MGVERRTFRKDGLAANDNSYTKGGVIMATQVSHPPIPSDAHQYVIGDEVPSWPVWYAAIYGTLVGVIGWVASAWPIVFIGLVALGLFILWFLRQYGKANGVPLLAAIRSQDGLKVAVYTIVAGLIGWAIGLLTGTFLIDMTAGLTNALGPLGVLVPIMALLLLTVAAIGLLLAASYRVRWATVVCLVALLVTVMFMTQQASGISQTPFEQQKEACVSHSTDFPAECE